MPDFPSVIPRPPEDSGPAGFVQAMNALADAVENLDERPSGGGVTDHGALTGLGDDDHTQYALADGSRGSFAAPSHDHDATDITTGTLSPARLGTGTRDGSRFLRDDGAWAEPPSGGGGGASTLGDLTDVDTTGATTGDVLKYDGASWIADAASAGTVASTDISDSTATGRAVLTAADAATARSAIGAGTSNLAIGTTGSTAAAGNDSRIVNAVPSSRTVNAKPLTGNIVLDADDVGARPDDWLPGVSEDSGNLLTLGSDDLPMLDPGDLPTGGGEGGGVTDHGALTGLSDDDHPQYALADGTRGSFAAPSHDHTAAQISDSTATGRAVLTAADAATARTAIGAGTSDFDGAYGSLSGKPTLGTASEQNVGYFATAAQGSLADTATQPGDLATVATTGDYDDLSNKPSIPDSPDDIGAAPATQTINAKTGAYTLVASDAGKLITMTSSTPRAITVPANVFTAGQRVDIADRGTARVTVVAGSGMTVNPPPGGSLVMEGRYAYASLVFISATQADLVGLVAAA